MHPVVVNQLAGVRVGAVDAKGSVFGAAVTAEAGRRQVLPGSKTEPRRVGEGFLQQQGNVQGNDFGIDSRQSSDQLPVEGRAQLRSGSLQRAAIDGRCQSQVGQQPDHDVAGTGRLQNLDAVCQAVRRGIRLGATLHAPLKKVVAAAGEVIQCIRVGAQIIGWQVTRARAFTRGGYGGD
ncbi:hypothetical protein D3C76_817140 [compost metagenome]